LIHGSPYIKSSRIDNSDYLTIENDFSFIQNPMTFFGMGDVSKKKEQQLGQTSCNALKALCWLAPTSVTIVSAEARQKYNTVKFRFADYLQAIDTCASYNDDSVNPSNYITTNDEEAKLVDTIAKTIKDHRLAAMISVLERSLTNYFIIIMEFSNKHRLYGELDTNLDKCANALDIIYSSFLSHKFAIVYETSNNKYNKIHNNANSDIVLGNPSLWIQARVLHDNKGKFIINVSVSVYGNKQEGSSIFMIDNDMAIKSVTNLNGFEDLGQFHIKFGYITSSEANEQSNLFNFDGILMSWNGRRSAHTYWNSVWNNVYKTKPLIARCELFVEHNRYIYKFLGSGNLHYAHPLAKQLFDMIMINLANPIDNTKPIISKELFQLIQTPV